MPNKFDIYLVGVGGQGIGLLSEAIARAIDYSGQRVIGADTHGLAQRGGMVSSHIRLGETPNSVLIARGNAELVISLERHEALRGMNDYLKDEGTIIYYDAVWQPLGVRLKKEREVSNHLISEEAAKRGITVIRVFLEDLADSRMQNVVLLSTIVRQGLIPGVLSEHCEVALKDLLSGSILEKNLELFGKLVEVVE